MGGGAWPFLVGGAICLVNSDNERDLNLLNSYANSATVSRGGGGSAVNFLEGLSVFNRRKFEAITGL
jgi:hypothetical protein